MKYKLYNKAFDHLIAAAYHFNLSINQDPEWKLKLTDRQRQNLRNFLNTLLRWVDEAEKEPDHEPIKVRVLPHLQGLVVLRPQGGEGCAGIHTSGYQPQG